MEAMVRGVLSISLDGLPATNAWRPGQPWRATRLTLRSGTGGRTRKCLEGSGPSHPIPIGFGEGTWKELV